MRRALLRIQLYAELFHQPSDPSDSDSGWETRLPEIKLFWSRYDEPEMRECKCIYAALVISVGHEIEYKEEALGGPGQNEDRVQHRGLPQSAEIY